MVAPALAVVPLYIYPTPGAWDPLTTSVTANPDVNFQVIINYESGPGAAQYPDSTYIAAIANLNSFANVQNICYVHTSWANRALADVETDVSTCAGWASYPDADIHMDGIFFDEAVAEYNATTAEYMNSITAFARNALGSGRDTIVFNPGEQVATEWYSIADYVVAFENSYSAYSASVLSSVPSEVRAQSQFIVYSFTGDDSAQTTLIDDLVAGDIGAIFATDQPGYTAFSSLWAQFCSALGAS
jgi:hypothetical protein